MDAEVGELTPGGFKVSTVGKGWDLFEVSCNEQEVVITPRGPLPARCTIRPAALFDHHPGFPDVNTVMGRIVFENKSVAAKRYRPFTKDPDRKPRELFLPVETSPEDDWPASTQRWRNWEKIAKRLCAEAHIQWSGLSDREVDSLVRFVPWPEPLEGCLLRALVASVHDRGKCIIEIGSFRGRSTSMLAIALGTLGSNLPVLSIDPHHDQPFNLNHVRTALAQLGEERRLVQVQMGSDQAAPLIAENSAALIFIDGDHSYDQVVADFNNYKSIVAPGGIIAFHDYGYAKHNELPEAAPDVRPAVDEHVMTDDDFEPVLLAATQLAFRRIR